MFFNNIIKHFSFNQALMSKIPCGCMYHARSCHFLSASHRVPNPLTPTNLHYSYCSAVSDWLGVNLKIRSLCYWPPPQAGKSQDGGVAA
jgi:hypothetical protein